MTEPSAEPVRREEAPGMKPDHEDPDTARRIDARTGELLAVLPQQAQAAVDAVYALQKTIRGLVFVGYQPIAQTALGKDARDVTEGAASALRYVQLIAEKVSREAEHAAADEEPLIDPDCRDGKCTSSVGDPCQHGCHQPEPISSDSQALMDSADSQGGSR